MSVNSFYGISRLRRGQQVDIEGKLCVIDLFRSSSGSSHCSGLNIAIITMILWVLIKCETSSLHFFCVPLSPFDLWLSPFPVLPSFHSNLCLLKLAALSINGQRLFSCEVPTALCCVQQETGVCHIASNAI